MRVFIIGLRVEQNTRLCKEFRQLDLTCIGDNKHHSAARLPKNISEYDKVISVTKFTHHGIHTALKDHDGYTMVAGGFSSVKKLLEEWVK